MPEEPLKHLLRVLPPWVSETMTECGRDGSDVGALTTPEEVRALVAKHGKQRAAFLVCMTCIETWSNHRSSTWETDPQGIVARWITRHDRYSRFPEPSHAGRYLHALAALVVAHPEEFRALVEGLGTVDLASRRRARRH